MAIPGDAVLKLILHNECAVLTEMASGEPATIRCGDSSKPTAKSSTGQLLHVILCKGAKIVKHSLNVLIGILHHTVEITAVQYWNA